VSKAPQVLKVFKVKLVPLAHKVRLELLAPLVLIPQ
jgi:hypothetical protein